MRLSALQGRSLWLLKLLVRKLRGKRKDGER